jgi:choline monooxygenase
MAMTIKKGINQAETLPTDFYQEESAFNIQKLNIFENSWLHIGDKLQYFQQPENLFPVTLLPGYLDEPLMISRSEDALNLLSNVCTHRGFLLVNHPQKARKIVCGYHGRRFSNDGQFEFMPEFKEVENFPRPCDHLKQLPLSFYSRFLFTSLNDNSAFQRIYNKLDERLYFLDFEKFRRADEYDQIYNINAHWALYVDNYLEGFHIPFVHETLGNMIDYGSYETISKDEVVLQIGYSDKGTPYFDLPENHPDYGQKITAYYYWVYPNFMMNIYPWGIQTNIVKPIKPDFTKVEFQYYIADEKLWELMGKDRVAEKTEREDEFVVEAVQQGMKSRFYKSGRYSPSKETGVYHFHQLVRANGGIK